MAPIMFVALAPLQLTLEVPRLRLYYSGAAAASAQASLPPAVARAVANATARQAPGPGPDECVPVGATPRQRVDRGRWPRRRRRQPWRFPS